MNVYDWMKENDHPDAPPMNEPGTREDPSNKPHIPDTINDDGTRELHSGAGGGRVTGEEEHHVEHTIADPYQPVEEEPEETVSTEGLVESVRKLFGAHNRGKGFKSVEETDPNAIRNFGAEIEKTFGNAEWVKQQTPVAGEIKASDISEYVDIKDPKESVKAAVNSFAGIINAMGEASRKFHTAIKPAMSLLGDGTNLTDEAYDALAKTLNEAKPISEYYQGPAKAPAVPTSKVDKCEPLPLEKFPELSSELEKGINSFTTIFADYVEIGKGINKAIEANFIYSGVFADDDAEDGAYKFKTKGSYNESAWATLGEKLQRKLTLGTIPAYGQAYQQLIKAIHYSVLLMERSVKGGKVSNEGFESVGKL